MSSPRSEPSGTRPEWVPDGLHPFAARHGAAAPAPTTSPQEAYADWPAQLTPRRLAWPLEEKGEPASS